jgi:hypothetical protein
VVSSHSVPPSILSLQDDYAFHGQRITAQHLQ